MKTAEEIIEYIYDMNLQNLTEKSSCDRAFKQGIEDTVNDLIELNLLNIPLVDSNEVKCCSCDAPFVRNCGTIDYCGNCGDDLE